MLFTLNIFQFQDQQKIAKVGLEIKLLTAEVEAEAEKWDEYAENDIVKRAKVYNYLKLKLKNYFAGNVCYVL